jgi:hypothetical protein
MRNIAWIAHPADSTPKLLKALLNQSLQRFQLFPQPIRARGAIPVICKIDRAFFGRDSANIDSGLVKKSNIRG